MYIYMYIWLYLLVHYFIVELQNSAAMQSPIPLELVHLFSHGHLHQQHMAHGCLCMVTTMMTSHKMAPILVYLCMHMQLTPLQIDIRDPFHGQLLAVKGRHLLTRIT